MSQELSLSSDTNTWKTVNPDVNKPVATVPDKSNVDVIRYPSDNSGQYGGGGGNNSAGSAGTGLCQDGQDGVVTGGAGAAGYAYVIQNNY